MKDKHFKYPFILDHYPNGGWVIWIGNNLGERSERYGAYSSTEKMISALLAELDPEGDNA